MSTLHVFRHAQASMFAADYDLLSERGREQARTLGQVLARRIGEGTPRFDALFCGPARRHLETAALVGEGLRASELPWPEPTVMPGFDEHDGQGLVAAALTHIARSKQSDEHTRALLALASEAADAQHDRRRRAKAWQLLFEAIMRRWIRGELELEGVESWADFDARVCDAFAHVRAHARGEVALFTSVGPIAVMLARVLELPAERAFEQAWRLYNASLTRFVYSGVRMTLDGFNEVAHLPHSQWTHR